MQNIFSASRITSLDGLRGIAVLLVVLGHFYPNFDGLTGTFVPYLANWLWVGVDIFFVLSGYLITAVLLAKPLDWTHYRQFITQRFLRVAPAVYVAFVFVLLIGVLIVGALDETVMPYFARYGWSIVTFMENLTFAFTDEPVVVAHFWSLGTEFQFYVLWGALVIVLATTSARWQRIAIIALLVIIVTQPVIRWAMQGVLNDATQADIIYRLTFTRLDGFAVGSLLALLVKSNWQPLRSVSVYIVVFSGMVWLICCVYEWQHGRYFVFYNNVLMQQIGFSLHAIFVGGVMGLLVSGTRCRVFEVAWLRWFGKISYSLYLWHFILLVLLQTKLQSVLPEHDVGLLMRYVVMLALSTGVAYLSYRFVEVPVNRWRHHLNTKA